MDKEIGDLKEAGLVEELMQDCTGQIQLQNRLGEKSRWQMEGTHLSSQGEDCDWWLVAGKSDGSPSGFVWWSLSLKSLRQEAITSLSTAQNDGLQTAQKAPLQTHTHPSINSAKHILCLVKGIDEQREKKRFA